MKIEAGKAYLTRCKYKVHIYAKSVYGNYFVGEIVGLHCKWVSCWFSDGRYNEFGGDHEYDLVEEIK